MIETITSVKNSTRGTIQDIEARFYDFIRRGIYYTITFLRNKFFKKAA